MKLAVVILACIAVPLAAVMTLTGQTMGSGDGKAHHVSFKKPDEVRTFPKGKLELAKLAGATIGRATFEPGWRWSTHVKPDAKTEWCEAPHYQYHVAGTLRVQMKDGTTFDCVPGDLSYLPEGHDAWVVGDKPAVVVDFQGMVDYAASKHAAKAK